MIMKNISNNHIQLAAPDAIIVVSKDRKIIVFNDAAEIFCSQFLIGQEIELFICGEYNTQAKDLLMLAGIETIEKPNVKIKEVINSIICSRTINKKEHHNES